MLFDYPVEEYAERYLDMFKLIFYLIGINSVDLFNLDCITSDGRVEFYRAKTGRLYSIKVEPEALSIINKYRGEKKLLYMADDYKRHTDYEFMAGIPTCFSRGMNARFVGIFLVNNLHI